MTATKLDPPDARRDGQVKVRGARRKNTGSSRDPSARRSPRSEVARSRYLLNLDRRRGAVVVEAGPRLPEEALRVDLEREGVRAGGHGPEAVGRGEAARRLVVDPLRDAGRAGLEDLVAVLHLPLDAER